MTVYEVRHGSNIVTVEAGTIPEAVLNAADELCVYDGLFDVFNCSAELLLGTYTWEEANEIYQ